jgi:predicted urease superfamily metal-dependent hydrolase
MLDLPFYIALGTAVLAVVVALWHRADVRRLTEERDEARDERDEAKENLDHAMTLIDRAIAAAREAQKTPAWDS